MHADTAAATDPTTPMIRVCSWCTPRAELERLNRAHRGQVTHLMCPACAARFEADLADQGQERRDAQLLAERDEEREADYQAERDGDACGTACGYCGRCS
jgi:hypothetical protein